jgi:hypothetical protein
MYTVVLRGRTRVLVKGDVTVLISDVPIIGNFVLSRLGRL